MHYVMISKFRAYGEIYDAQLTEKGELYLPYGEAVKYLTYYKPECLFDTYSEAEAYLDTQLKNPPALPHAV